MAQLKLLSHVNPLHIFKVWLKKDYFDNILCYFSHQNNVPLTWGSLHCYHLNICPASIKQTCGKIWGLWLQLGHWQCQQDPDQRILERVSQGTSSCWSWARWSISSLDKGTMGIYWSWRGKITILRSNLWLYVWLICLNVCLKSKKFLWKSCKVIQQFHIGETGRLQASAWLSR